MAAIIRAETYYRRPSTCSIEAWDAAPPSEKALIYLESVLQLRIPRPDGPNDMQTWARIDAGRWLAECPTDGCHSAQVISPLDPRMTCCRCFAGWSALLVPADPDAVEAPLTSLPRAEQWWWADDDPANPANQQPTYPYPPTEQFVRGEQQ
ncbi:hypothetical protein AB0E27_24950 [Streptomyces sparsogenes]|uniref:hypothetical protein n=1 Tax=Streptomyces sparsogenes TaxID=67365 RepID=UPI0033D2A5EE